MFKFHKVGQKERTQIAELFDGIEDSMVTAYLQGYMGDAYVDKLPDPTVGMIISGEYTFFGGDPDTTLAKELARSVFYVNQSMNTVAIFSEKNNDWEKTLMQVSENHPSSVQRFAIKQKDYRFDESLLQLYINKLPQEYVLKKFDSNLYSQAMQEDWSKEFCETFDSAEDYLKKGFGYGVVYDGKLVAGTSTMTVYDGGTEIQVATHPEHRMKGLALSTASAFILECIQRNIRPCWDAANEASLHMALELGYEYKGEYTTIHMHVSLS